MQTRKTRSHRTRCSFNDPALTMGFTAGFRVRNFKQRCTFLSEKNKSWKLQLSPIRCWKSSGTVSKHLLVDGCAGPAGRRPRFEPCFSRAFLFLSACCSRTAAVTCYRPSPCTQPHWLTTRRAPVACRRLLASGQLVLGGLSQKALS